MNTQTDSRITKIMEHLEDTILHLQMSNLPDPKKADLDGLLQEAVSFLRAEVLS